MFVSATVLVSAFSRRSKLFKCLTVLFDYQRLVCHTLSVSFFCLITGLMLTVLFLLKTHSLQVIYCILSVCLQFT